MLTSVVAAIALLIGPLLAPAAAHVAGPNRSGEVVLAWNDQALNTIRATNGSDAQAARLYAMVNVAMYDAVNGLARGRARYAPALVPPSENASGDPVVAAAVAAHDVLTALYPARAATYDAQLSSDTADTKSPGQSAHGREWGAHVAASVSAARANDGSSPTESQGPGTGPGQFAASWSGVQFRNLKPFAIADPAVYVSSGPPALTSAAYATAFNEVKDVGNQANPDAEKLATFQYWSLGGNTDQPPGAWVQVAQVVARDRTLDLADTARLFALETMTLADTVAPTYTTKFVFHSWRPTSAIRQADTDGNDATIADPSWTARAGSAGSSPEHWSGHSSFSAAAAAVLAGFFCTDAVPFTLVTDSAPGGQARSYSTLSAAAAEAGRSRVVGGFHFEFSNQAGLVAGRAIADEVLDHALLPTHPSHHGCGR